MGSFFEIFLERTALFSCPNYELSVNNAEQEERRRYQCPLQFYGNQHAQYKLGKFYLTGELVNKDIETALRYLKDAAQRNNQFAQYTLGKLYLQGKEVHQDREAAKQWLELSAAQGNQYAQFFLDRFNDFRDPSILMSTTRLLHHMSRIFQNNSQPPTNPNGIRIDSKRRRRLQEKRMAMGHKRDDHEEQINYQQSM